MTSDKSTSKELTDVRRKAIKEFHHSAVMVLDTNGTIINWNKGAERIKGYSPEEIIGQNFSIFYMPADRQKGVPEKCLQMALQQGYAIYSGKRVRKDGSIFFGIMFLTTLYNNKQTPTGFAKLTREVSPDEL